MAPANHPIGGSRPRILQVHSHSWWPTEVLRPWSCVAGFPTSGRAFCVGILVVLRTPKNHNPEWGGEGETGPKKKTTQAKFHLLKRFRALSQVLPNSLKSRNLGKQPPTSGFRTFRFHFRPEGCVAHLSRPILSSMANGTSGAPVLPHPPILSSTGQELELTARESATPTFGFLLKQVGS